MNPVRIYLFDTFQIERETASGPSPIPIRSKKLQTMLAYLTLFRQKPIERPQLSQALWPRAGAAAARRNLREYLYRARQLLSGIFPHTAVLESDEQYLYFHLPDSCRVDVEIFAQTVAAAEAAPVPEQAISLWEDALALYRGDLLAAVYDDWADAERERLRQLYLNALERLAAARQNSGDYSGAARAIQRLLENDPLEEAAHRRLMELYVAAGDRARALQQYEICRRILQEKLDAPPLPQTEALYRAIQTGQYVPPIPPPAALPPLPRPPFVGRREELAQLDAAGRRARHGRFQALIISGESGQGKTRLAEEWLAADDAAVILRGRGHEFEQTIPYRPLLDALQQSLGQIPWDSLPPVAAHAWLAPLAQLLPDLYHRLPRLALTSPVTDNETAHHIMEGMTQLLLSLARRQPVILFLDDLHWIDDPAWRYLAFLSRRAAAAPLLVLGTFCASDAAPEARRRLRALLRDPAVHLLPLPSLDAADIAALARQTLPQGEAAAAQLYRLSQGNPFFAAELIRAWQDDPAASPQRPPAAIQTLIENRLDRLEDDSRAALSLAAAIGRDFSFDLLLAAARLPEERLLGWLEEWLARGLLTEREHGRYDFSHSQIRDVAYRRLSRPRRQRFHYQIAAALEQRRPDDVDRIARHYRRSHRPAQAVPALLAAGRRALNARSYAEAAEIGRALLEICRETPAQTGPAEQLELNLQLALAYAFAGSAAEALSRLETAGRLAESLDDPARASEVALRIAQNYWVRGDAPAARRHAERALALGQVSPDAARETAVLRLLGRIAVAQGYFEIAVNYLNKSLAGEANRLNQANIHGYLATAYGHLGQADAAVTALETALRLARELQSPALLAVMRVNAAVAWNALDNWAEARALAAQGLEECLAHEIGVYAFIARAVLGRALHFLGDPAQSRQHLRLADEWAETHNYRLFRYLIPLYRAEIALREGDAAAAKTHAARALALAAQTGNRWARRRIDEMALPLDD